MHIVVINGPNLNMLGQREPERYGSLTLADVERMISARAGELGAAVEFFQSNSEGELITRVQQCRDKADGIILNPGAYTHTSYALHDALLAAEVPAIEVHISNVHQRESWRHVSVTAAACKGQIVGLGTDGYLLALEAFARMKEGK